MENDTSLVTKENSSVGIFYIVTRGNADFEKAKDKCSKMKPIKSQLAILNNPAEFDAAMRFIKSKGTYFWIGLLKKPNNGPVRWIDGTNYSLDNNITHINYTGCRGVLLKNDRTQPLLATDCSAKHNYLCFTPTQVTSTASTTQELTSSVQHLTSGTPQNTKFFTQQYTSSSSNSDLLATRTTHQTNQGTSTESLSLALTVGLPVALGLLLVLIVGYLVWKMCFKEGKKESNDAEVQFNEIYAGNDNAAYSEPNEQNEAAYYSPVSKDEVPENAYEVLQDSDAAAATRDVPDQHNQAACYSHASYEQDLKAEHQYDVTENDNHTRVKEADGEYSGLTNK